MVTVQCSVPHAAGNNIPTQSRTYTFPGADSTQRCWHIMLTGSHLAPNRSTLTTIQRLDYIHAVQCLMSKPARTPSTAASGAKTRFDDFVATHINQTLTIHYTANFLAWHRYFMWLYEQALKEECGFTGISPVSHSPILLKNLYCYTILVFIPNGEHCIAASMHTLTDTWPMIVLGLGTNGAIWIGELDPLRWQRYVSIWQRRVYCQ